MVNVVDLSERRRYEPRLAHRADHDALTGLPNRRRFDAALAEHLDPVRPVGPARCPAAARPRPLQGGQRHPRHDAGDELIVSTAAALRGSLREGDLVARLGGDEFAILLADADRQGAERVAEVVVEGVRANSRTLEGVNRRVTASIGVVTFAAADERAEDILALADMLMYDAKDAGRDGFTVLGDGRSVQPRSGARLEWRARIEAPLENDDFELYLQPVLHLDTGRVTGAEALIRLVDRDLPVSPGAFIAVAERAGLVPAVDDWVVRQRVQTLRRLLEVDPAMRSAVNLSGALDRRPGDRADPRARAARPGRRPAPPHRGGHRDRRRRRRRGGPPLRRAAALARRAVRARRLRGRLRLLLGVDYAQGYLIGAPVPFDQFVAAHLGGDRGLWLGLPAVEDDAQPHPVVAPR